MDKWRKVGTNHYRRMASGQAEYDVRKSQDVWFIRLVAGPCTSDVAKVKADNVREMKAKVSDWIAKNEEKKAANVNPMFR